MVMTVKRVKAKLSFTVTSDRDVLFPQSIAGCVPAIPHRKDHTILLWGSGPRAAWSGWARY
jgi:hypothetical protein